MQDDPTPQRAPDQPRTVFQKAVSDVLAQRLEGIAQEIRTAGTAQAGLFASGESLCLLSAVLQSTLRKIDEIFELEGFVFTPACSLLLDLFQAKTRGSMISSVVLCQSVHCPEPVAKRWISALERMQLVERIGKDNNKAWISLTEKGYLKTIEALRLLL